MIDASCQPRCFHICFVRSFPSRSLKLMEVRIPSVMRPKKPMLIRDGCHAKRVPARYCFKDLVCFQYRWKMIQSRWCHNSLTPLWYIAIYRITCSSILSQLFDWSRHWVSGGQCATHRLWPAGDKASYPRYPKMCISSIVKVRSAGTCSFEWLAIPTHTNLWLLAGCLIYPSTRISTVMMTSLRMVASWTLIFSMYHYAGAEY